MRGRLSSLLENRPVAVGLALRLVLAVALPVLLDDGLLLRGVRYTDVDYDVFSDAAAHAACGRSPYARHTYRYTPFLASLLALPLRCEGTQGGLVGAVLSTRYFGKILFCVADVVCGHIIALLRRRGRRLSRASGYPGGGPDGGGKKWLALSLELKDALWWLYNPLPINICTRGSAESLVVLLPVLATVAIADMYETEPAMSRRWRGARPILLRACLAGVLHGIGIHAKLYPVIYTVSFMANFSRQQQQRKRMFAMDSMQRQQHSPGDVGWGHLLSVEMRVLEGPKAYYGSGTDTTFPWRHPLRIMVLAMLWVQRLFFTMSSILFLLCSAGTVAGLTYLAYYYHGQEALDEGLLYHFGRVDHRHNYSMYWYWIYLVRGRSEVLSDGLGANATAPLSASAWGHVPLIPQVLVLGFSSLGIAPYDLGLALFCQTFSFVAFNKVITAQYFTWYLCLLPLCSDRIRWNSRRMHLSLGALGVSIVVWLLSAFSLEMLGWRTHRQVWVASVFFFGANMNLLCSILNGYKSKKESKKLSIPGEGWAFKPKSY